MELTFCICDGALLISLHCGVIFSAIDVRPEDIVETGRLMLISVCGGKILFYGQNATNILGTVASSSSTATPYALLVNSPLIL